jgi:PhzF family phenazine biosynthesis protein
MPTLTLYQVDAFTDHVFGGNPAAVCILDQWLTDAEMQAIGNENNLAETAFVVPDGDQYHIRWFTPDVEVDLCGHATLASAFVLKMVLKVPQKVLKFQTLSKGVLSVTQEEHQFFLNFPTDRIAPIAPLEGVLEGLGAAPVEYWKGETDFIVVLENEAAVARLQPDMRWIKQLGERGLIVTAIGDQVDFVSRFFAPQSGVDEDYVTGSAHTSLIPLWASKLGKQQMQARQISQRLGVLDCEDQGERVRIGGEARLYLKGEIYLP